MRRRQSDLVGVAQVEVVDAAYEGFETHSLQGGAEGGDKSCFAGALHAVEADEEGDRGAEGVVGVEAGEDEGDAVGGFVVEYGGGGGGRGGGGGIE